MYAYLDQISTLHYITTYTVPEIFFFFSPKNILLSNISPTIPIFLQESKIGSSTYRPGSCTIELQLKLKVNCRPTKVNNCRIKFGLVTQPTVVGSRPAQIFAYNSLSAAIHFVHDSAHKLPEIIYSLLLHIPTYYFYLLLKKVQQSACDCGECTEPSHSSICH